MNSPILSARKSTSPLKIKVSPVKKALQKASNLGKHVKEQINLNITGCIMEAGAVTESQTVGENTVLEHTQEDQMKEIEILEPSKTSTNSAAADEN